MVSTIAVDERSRLRRSHCQESVLSTDARRASVDNTRKTIVNAAGVSAQGCDPGTLVQRIRDYLTKAFKQEAVRLVYSSGKSVAQGALDLGILKSKKWVNDSDIL